MAARENELCARVATALCEGSASLKALETEAGCKHRSELKLVVEGSVSKNLKGWDDLVKLLESYILSFEI